MKMIKVVKDKLFQKNINWKKCVIISLLLIIVGTFMSFYCVPLIVKLIVKYVSVLKPGHFVRKKHENQIPFTYKLYLWNVTNPNEISAGTEKPKMQEVGPYVFSQFKQKFDTFDDAADDLYSFNLWNIYRFNPKLSAPLTGDEIVTILNVVLVSTVVKVKLERPHLMETVTESMDILFKNPSSIFMTLTAMEFIENGIQVDCNQTAFPAKVVCAEMRRHRTLKVTNAEKGLISFRWFDRLNDSIQARYTLLRGSKNIHDVGRIVYVNDKPKLNVFKENEKCNLINGTDKLFFPPFQQSNDVIWVYSDDACKSFPLRYQYMENLRGTKVAWKSLDLSDPLVNLHLTKRNLNMSNACECNQFVGCAPPGTINMADCVDIYVFGSLPHFYLADTNVLKSVEGMNPKEHLHKAGIYFELLTGSPILSLERFQINWLLKRIPEYNIFSSISDNTWIPVIWFEESYSIKKLDLALVVFSTISKMLGVLTGYILIGIGIFGFILAIFLRLHQDASVIPNALNNKNEK